MATAKFFIQVAGWLVGIPLEILLVNAMLRGPWRRYPLVFLYVAASFITTLVEIPLGTQAWLTGSASALTHYAKVYWVDEWIMQVLVFATVLTLIDRAISVARRRRVMRVSLAACTILVAGISFLIHYRPAPVKFGYWMTPWTQDLSVCATVLDLALWMMLVASRPGDRRLLLISGALGMQFTGEAIGTAILKLSIPDSMAVLALAGSVITMLTNLACFFVWWRTFRARETGPVAAVAGRLS